MSELHNGIALQMLLEKLYSIPCVYLIMTYRFDELSIKLSEDKVSFEKINEIYKDIFNGKILLIHYNKRKLDENLIALAQYGDYNEDGYSITQYIG